VEFVCAETCGLALCAHSLHIPDTDLELYEIHQDFYNTNVCYSVMFLLMYTQTIPHPVGTYVFVFYFCPPLQLFEISSLFFVLCVFFVHDIVD
jgi:hypothetical protein